MSAPVSVREISLEFIRALEVILWVVGVVRVGLSRHPRQARGRQKKAESNRSSSLSDLISLSNVSHNVFMVLCAAAVS
mgnify:CR=1 FL=1